MYQQNENLRCNAMNNETEGKSSESEKKLLKQDADELMMYIVTLVSQLSALISDKNKLNTSKRDCPECSSFRNTIENVQKKLNHFLDADAHSSHAQSVTGDQICKNHISQIKALQKELSNRPTENQELQQLNTDLSQQLQQLQQQHAAVSQELLELKDKAAHMTSQLVAYKEDFDSEREDRERAHGVISDLRVQLQQLCEQLHRYESSSSHHPSRPKSYPQQQPSFLQARGISAPTAPPLNQGHLYSDVTIDTSAAATGSRSRPSVISRSVYQCDSDASSREIPMTSFSAGKSVDKEKPEVKSEYRATGVDAKRNLVTSGTQSRHGLVTTGTQPRHGLVTTGTQPRHGLVTSGTQPRHGLVKGVTENQQAALQRFEKFKPANQNTESLELTNRDWFIVDGETEVDGDNAAEGIEILRCPRCRKSYTAEFHYELLVHMDECV